MNRGYPRAATSSGLLVLRPGSPEVRVLAPGAFNARWITEGIVARHVNHVTLHDAATGAVVRSLAVPQGQGATGAGWDGRTVLIRLLPAQMQLHDVATGRTWEWEDAHAGELRDHALAPQGTMVAYIAAIPEQKNAMSLRVWTGREAVELLRVHEPERAVLAGWMPDGEHLLVVRRTLPPEAQPPQTPVTTLWRVPVRGGSPDMTALSMEALRDVSIHPDGRRVAFNAGFKRAEHWILENVVPP